MREDLPYWLALTRFPKFGAVRLGKLARHFSSMKHVFDASAIDLIEAGLRPEIVSRFLQEKIHLNPEKEMELIQKHDITAITILDEEYPKLLKEIYDPPAVLFVKGELPAMDAKYIAIVGSRRATNYGLRATESIVGPLAKSNVIIVSGLAHGIDSIAHRTAIESGGITLAVLGSGIDSDSIYPSHNRTLASQIIASGGAIISEFPVGSPPLKHHFPFRNRIIAGLCHGTLIVEAAQQSGSLITAKLAMDANRNVYAVPGSIDMPLSEGPNNLIKSGAIPVTQASDLYNIDPIIERKIYQPSNSNEEIIYNILDREPKHIDEIVRSTNIPIQNTSSTLSILEIKGVIRHQGGKFYTRTT